MITRDCWSLRVALVLSVRSCQQNQCMGFWLSITIMRPEPSVAYCATRAMSVSADSKMTHSCFGPLWIISKNPKEG